MGQVLPLKEVIKRINEETDIAQLYSELIQEGKILPSAITNPYLKDENGNVKISFEIDFAEDLSEYVMIECPFHPTKSTNSTSLHRLNGSFKCFAGCPSKGLTVDIISFYMVLVKGIPFEDLPDKETKGYGSEAAKRAFMETTKELGERIGIEIEKEGKKISEEDRKMYRILEIRKRTSDLYRWALKNHNRANEAKEYLLQERGFQYSLIPFEELADIVHFGYAPGWSWAYDRLKKYYSDEELLEAHVVKQFDKYDHNKKPTGEKFMVDFLNSKGITMDYDYGGKVFNIYERRFTADKDKRHMRLKVVRGLLDVPINFEGIKKHRKNILVEGELSYATWRALKFENVFAAKGINGFKDEHIAQLKEVRDKSREKSNGTRCETFYLCLDNDSSGKEAILILGKKLLKEGFSVRVIRMPSWEETDPETKEVKVKGDPNDILVKYKDKARGVFEDLLSKSITFEAYMILTGLRDGSLVSFGDKVEALKRVRPYLDQIHKEELFFISYEIADILKIDPSVLHKIWIFQEEEKVQDDAYQYSWVFLMDNPDLHKKFEKTTFRHHLVPIGAENVVEIMQKIMKHAHIKNVIIHSSMETKLKQTLFQGLKDYKFAMFAEKEEMLQKERFTDEEVQQHFQTIV